MRRTMLAGAAAALALLAASPAGAHNAGCVQTGNGKWVFVGSNKEAPLVPEQNPNRNAETGQLDLQPGRGDQYGARFAADQGNSAVERPTKCTAPEPRA
ncbi:MAG TPA: hypothetical protein VNK94_01785 [Gaiellaceae bacterium]|nr:hypothetical protein [Gaiellaceae bacterium]